MATVGASPAKEKYAHEAHFFMHNSRAQIQQLKASLGPDVYVGKYDIPSLNINAPLGTSIF